MKVSDFVKIARSDPDRAEMLLIVDTAIKQDFLRESDTDGVDEVFDNIDGKVYEVLSEIYD